MADFLTSIHFGVDMFNFWYFFFLVLSAGAIVGLYFALRKASPFVKDSVIFSLLALGFILHFLKNYIPPYADYSTGSYVFTDRGMRDCWFVNICGANIALFPFLFFSKNKHVKDYMVYIGVLSGFIALFYPQEPIVKGGGSIFNINATTQIEEIWDVLRFYYHHWMVIAAPLLMVLLKRHTLSYKRILSAPIGLLLLMLFIILNQIFQSELGFIPLRSQDFLDINYKNSSYIWGPGTNDAIGNFLAIFCPEFFKTIPIGEFKGQIKYWPWFWMIVPVFVLVTPLSFAVCMIFDHKQFGKDVVWFVKHVKAGGLKEDFKKLGKKIMATVHAQPNAEEECCCTACEEEAQSTQE
ncbi:MAG: hypothetical protein E7349_03080 [Clostridiales bacterium]|nr:hypothetical protein [Clostridiales bacterium]